MLRTTLLVALALPTAASAEPASTVPRAAAGEAAGRPRKPLVAYVLGGARRVPGYPRVREYRAPEQEPAPPAETSDVKVIEVTESPEALALTRPWYPSLLLGAVATGARLPVHGVVHARSPRGCSTRTWYALEPFGWLCSRSARPTDEPATSDPSIRPIEGSSLPYRYVMVHVPEGESLPMWASLDDLHQGLEPERQLERGDTVAIEHGTTHEGAGYWVSVEGKVFPKRKTALLKSESSWSGETLDEHAVLPFGWTTAARSTVFADAGGGAAAHEPLPRRTRVVILEQAGEGRGRMLRVGDGHWLRALDVNEVWRRARPEGITAAQQWIDVDLGEQVLVAYEGDRPVFATLTASGRAVPTPRGNYPVWAKVAAITMKSQPYEDKAYFVNKVPWVLFFQAHNAIHGAYWHDRFGVTKSHGCINVAPLDARRLFEWLQPPLPAGWTGYRFENLALAPTLHVRNSHARVELVQERPIGPPDRELEAQKLEDAEERRAAAALAPASPMP